MDHQKILRDIAQQNFKPVYFLMGEEPYYIDIISQYLDKYVVSEEEKAFNHTVLYGKDTSVDIILESAKRFPMASKYNLVVVKEAQNLKKIDDLEKYFEQPNPETVLVLCYKYKAADKRKKYIKAVAKTGLLYNSEKIKEYKLAQWITNFVRQKEFTITEKGSILLAEFLGNDLSKISSELEKLAIVLPERTKITEKHIERNIGISKDYNVFELVNAVAIKDIKKTYRILNYFAHNPKASHITVITSNLFNHFSRIMRFHFLEDQSESHVASKLKIHPFVAKNLRNSADKYSRKKTAQCIHLLREYDMKSKGVGNTGSVGQGELLKELVFQILH